MAITYLNLDTAPFHRKRVPDSIRAGFALLTPSDGGAQVSTFVAVTPGGTLTGVYGAGGSVSLVDSLLGTIASLASGLVASFATSVLPTLPLTISNLVAAKHTSTLPTFPITVATGVNDTFVWTPSGGAPEIFTMAAATITTAGGLVTALGAATGAVSAEAFSTKATVSTSSGNLVITAIAAGTSHNGDKITPGATSVAVTLGLANPSTLTGGTLANNNFVWTPGGGNGTPETFTIGAGTYTTAGDLVTAINAAIGGSSEAFSTIVTVTTTAGNLVFTMTSPEGSADNGNRISTGSADALVTLGITSPFTFAGGSGDDEGPAGSVAFWFA